MRLATVILVCASLTGCSRSPVAPSPLPLSQRPVILALVGQSNAGLARPIFAQQTSLLTLVPIRFNGPTIASWDVGEGCWTTLAEDIRGQLMDAFVFWQGESDIYNPLYGQALADFVRRVRAEVGNPELLIVLMQYGPAYSGFSVNGAGSEAASIAFVAQDPHALYVLTHDLEWLPDGGHMTEAGYAAVAQRIVAMIRQKLLS